MSVVELHPVEQSTTDTAAEAPLLLTIEAAARLLSIGRSMAYELASNGELPTVRLGRKRLVRRSDLLEFVERLGAWS